MEENKNILCEICGSLASSLYARCIEYYCDSCYKLVHARKEKAEHEKSAINYIIPVETKCQNHPKYPKELFCVDEKGKK